MDQHVITLPEITLKDVYGNDCKKISGQYTQEELINHLIEIWVPFHECHQCPRVNTCKHPVPHPYNTQKKAEIKCGVKADVIKNFIKKTIDKTTEYNQTELYHYFSAAFHISEYAINSETLIGMLTEEEWIDIFGKSSTIVYETAINLREELNTAAQHLSFTPGLYNRKPILLVEGKCERAFLEKLRETHISWFSDLRIEVYGGNGNRTPKRIEMRLDKYIEDGYSCYMQGDADGHEKGIFDKLIRNKKVKQENTFTFQFDFESAFPPKMLIRGIKNLGFLEKVDPEQLEEEYTKDESINHFLRRRYNFNTEEIKADLADELGWIMIQILEAHGMPENFLKKTEIGEFLMFVIQMGHPN